jgi:NADH-quinone oxidoreductase subunit F
MECSVLVECFKKGSLMTNKKVTLKPVSPEIDSLVKQHGARQEAVLEILTEIQAKNGVLTRDTLDGVASSLDMSPARVQGIATFYSMLEVSQEIHQQDRRTVRICDGPVCWLFSRYNKSITDEVSKGHPELKIERSSCLGLCDRAPAALLGDEQGGTILSTNKGEVLLEETKNYKDYYIPRPGEVRVLLENGGKMDPDSLESCLALGAYQGLQEALKHSPEQVLQEVEKSNLLGRGGAGFPVGRKWRYVATESRIPKFIVCNADESEPLIFKDRVLIDTNPHKILEGMAIAAYATGATTGYIYIRGEYTNQARRLEFAINQAEKAAWLGENIAGTGFSFIVHVHRGAGAYICGEETALIESLEDRKSVV